jgi:hypothetical protein
MALRCRRVGAVHSITSGLMHRKMCAVRVCLGGPADRSAIRSAIEFMAHALAESPTLTSTFL